MDHDTIQQFARALAKPYRITRGARFRLKDFDPGDTGPLKDADKPRAQQALQAGKEALAQLQTMLYAHDRWSVLLIFQAMDAAGKDGAIKHVMSGIDPQGCQVYSFKAAVRRGARPRLAVALLACVARARAHRHLQSQLLRGSAGREGASARSSPGRSCRRDWSARASGSERYQDIRAMERHLARSGTLILKFFLNMSKGEQKKQFLERIDDPAKNWKFAAGDVKERAHWNAYMDAYQSMIRETATPHAPWYVVPADNKWYTRIVVAAAIVDGLASLDLHYPKLDKAKLAELAAARKALMAEPR